MGRFSPIRDALDKWRKFFRSSSVRSLIVLSLVLAFFLYPWKPSGPIGYDASDPHLAFVTPGLDGQAVFDHEAQTVDLRSSVRGGPRIDFVASESSFEFNSGLEVINQSISASSGTPSQESNFSSAMSLKMWYPESSEAVLLEYRITNANSGQIVFETITPSVNFSSVVTYYTPGEQFRFTASWNRLSSLALSLVNETGFSFYWNSTDRTFPRVSNLLSMRQMDLSVQPLGSGFESSVRFAQPLYLFPGNGRFASIAGDASPYIACLAVLGSVGLLFGPEEKKAVKLLLALVRNILRDVPNRLKSHWKAFVILASAEIVYGIVSLIFGGHPFDNIVFKSWIYGAQLSGIQGIYARTSSVGDSFVRADHSPWSSLGFAYLPLAAYLFVVLSLVLPSLGLFSDQSAMFQSVALESQVKLALGSFTIIAGGFLYFAIVRVTNSQRYGLIAMTIFLLNPAIIFDSAVWGETDGVMYLILIVAAYLAFRRPSIFLTFLPFLLEFKQTGVLLLYPGAVLLLTSRTKLVPLVQGLGRASYVLFVGMVPFVFSGVLPSAMYLPLFQKILDIGTPYGSGTPVVSPDTYTTWTGVTGFLNASGINRLQYPADRPLLWVFSFSALGSVLFVVLLALSLLNIRLRKGPLSASFWYLSIGLVSIIFTAVLTGAASRYYTLAIPGLVGAGGLGWASFSKLQKQLLATTTIIISGISLWTMTGLFTWIMTHDLQIIRGFQGSQNPLVGIVDQFYLNDVIISIGSLAAVLAVAFSTYLVISLGRIRPDDT